jgi:type I restriction enzyme, S subunit
MSLMRIEDLFNFEKGILQSSKCTEGEFDFITASSEWKTHNEYTHNCEALVFAAAASGSLGRTHYVNGKFISSDLCFIITAKDPKKFPIDLKFYHMIFNEFKSDIVNSTKAGTSKEAIGMKAFGNYKLPYFDIDKQIETKVQFVNMQHSKVELFSELNHQLDLIKQLRQAFLREAMQGKLVKSTNTKETGQQLLAKIKAEKAKLIAEKKLKKEKELPSIAEDEITFEIPKHWAWCRLGELSLFSEAGKSFRCNEIVISGDEWGVIKLSAVSWNKFQEDQNKLYSKTKPLDVTAQILKGDFIISRANTSELVGKSVVVNSISKNLLLSDKTIRFKFSDSISTEFINLCNNTNIARIYYALKGTGSSPSMKNIKREHMNELLIPLPPLHEQEQIVTKLEELMEFCDGLEQSIKESQGYNEKLLQQVLREALQGEKTK